VSIQHFAGGEKELCAAAADLASQFVGVPMLRFKVQKGKGGMLAVGGEAGRGRCGGRRVGERSGEPWMDEVVGYAFAGETRATMRELSERCRDV